MEDGLWIPNSGFWILRGVQGRNGHGGPAASTVEDGFWILDSGFWILDSEVPSLALSRNHGFWIMDSRFWVLRVVPGSLERGLWILDSGFWILDSRLSIVREYMNSRNNL